LLRFRGLILIRWQVGDVVPRGPEEGLVEATLINEVSDEPGGAAKHENGVQNAALDVLVSLTPGNLTNQNM
jgi:hypothetical protein